MKAEKRTDKVIVEKIIGYCDTIIELMEEFNNSYELYLKKPAFQLSGNMCIIQIGELIKHLTADFKNQHSEIEYRKIIAMRNLHTHDYENVDFEIMWETLTQDVPTLKKSLQEIYPTLRED